MSVAATEQVTVPTETEQLKAYTALLLTMDEFKAKALAYYQQGASPTEKVGRVKAIQEALEAFKTPFTIAAEEKIDPKTGEELYICPGGMVCVGGVCVQDIGLSLE